MASPTWNGNKPGTLERVSDARLEQLAADRTGYDLYNGPDAARETEWLSILDELRAWRKYKLTDEEKAALRELLGVIPSGNAAVDAITRLAGNGARNG